MSPEEAAATYVVIPAYNEESVVRQTVQRVAAIGVHVVVVDDASTDGTLSELRGLSVEHRLRDAHLSKPLREELEAMRKKALAGALTASEFRALRDRGRRTATSLRSVLVRLRTIRGATDRIEKFPAAARAGIDDTIRALEAAVGAADGPARLTGLHARMLARIGSRRSITVA